MSVVVTAEPELVVVAIADVLGLVDRVAPATALVFGAVAPEAIAALGSEYAPCSPDQPLSGPPVDASAYPVPPP